MRWTSTSINERLDQLGAAAKKSLGQNFLVSDHVIEKIVQQVLALKPEKLLEIGPGIGALTERFLELKMPPDVIELDSRFAQFWRDRNLQVTEVDALQYDWKQIKDKEITVLVSNLPYQIAASIVVDRSLDLQPFRGMVLMFQKEVAQKIKAAHASEHYGMLSVFSQEFWNIETVLEASSKDFYPPPRVASRVLCFQVRASALENKKGYLRFLKACFLHPRKLMASNLAERTPLSKEEIVQILKSQGINEKCRAEELKQKQFSDLFLKMSERCPF